MKDWKYLIAHIFVLFAGISSAIHNTWTVGYYFNGEQPPVESITSLIQFIHFLGWILPALLTAITLDVGQIVTSYEIKKHGLTIWRGLTFTLLAISTYYLQWLYLANHMPNLHLSDAIIGTSKEYAVLWNSASMWIIPLLMPLSVILYTFSGNKQSAENLHSETVMPEIRISKIEDTQPPQLEAKSANPLLEDSHLLHFEENESVNLLWCPDCGWNTGEKESLDVAHRALRVHQSRHCEKQNCEVQS